MEFSLCYQYQSAELISWEKKENHRMEIISLRIANISGLELTSQSQSVLTDSLFYLDNTQIYSSHQVV